MDISAIGSKILEFIKKYRYVILVLVIGIGLMAIPGKDTDEPEATVIAASPGEFQDPTEDLMRILGQIQGAGKVQLLLTVNAGEKTVYQTDQDSSASDENSSLRLETVIVTDSDRAEKGLTQQVFAPEYRGAIVVCQGADNAAVRLAIVEAVSDVTGLGTDRISVLKMK